MCDVLYPHQGQHRRHAASFALQPTCHINMIGPCIFQREANELAASPKSPANRRTRKPWRASPADDG